MTVLEAIGQAYQNGYANGYEAGKNDAVPVVRCKDCKHRERVSWCVELKDNDFCSYGERRTE